MFIKAQPGYELWLWNVFIKCQPGCEQGFWIAASANSYFQPAWYKNKFNLIWFDFAKSNNHFDLTLPRIQYDMIDVSPASCSAGINNCFDFAGSNTDFNFILLTAITIFICITTRSLMEIMTRFLSAIYFTCLASTTRSVNVFRRKRCLFSTWGLLCKNLVSNTFSKFWQILTGSRIRKSSVRSWSFITWMENKNGHLGKVNHGKFSTKSFSKHQKSTSSPFCQPPPASISKM